MAINDIPNAKDTKKMRKLMEKFDTDFDDDPTEIFDKSELRTTEIDADFLFDLAELARGAKAETVEIALQDEFPVLGRFWNKEGSKVGRVMVGPRTSHAAHADEPLVKVTDQPEQTTLYAIVDEAYEHPVQEWLKQGDERELFTEEGNARYHRDKVNADKAAVYELTARRVAGDAQ